MAIPPYFATTTLRTLLAGGAPADHVRDIASRTRVDLIVGQGLDAALAAAAFVELAARTFASIRIRGSSALRAELERTAAAINPHLSRPIKGRPVKVSVALQGTAHADLVFSGHGWWVGPVAPETDASGISFGPLAAGVLAFSEAFKSVYGEVLAPLMPVKCSGPGWSLLGWKAGNVAESDLQPVVDLGLSQSALVGCGAVGQALSFALQRLPVRSGHVDLIDPQRLSRNNLQRYVGTRYKDVAARLRKVDLARRRIPSELTATMYGDTWADYRRSASEPRVVLSALDSAVDRRSLQPSLPELIINGWTRTWECGATLHRFDSSAQCLTCTYLPREPGAVGNDMNELVGQLGLEPIRVVALLAGADLQASDLATIALRRRLKAAELAPWEGESIRQLYGHLCGIAEIPAPERENYVVPFPQASFLAGIFLAAHFVQYAAGLPTTLQPIEVSLLRGPGAIWALPVARKDQHPAPCICKDPDYLDAYTTKWARQSRA